MCNIFLKRKKICVRIKVWERYTLLIWIFIKGGIILEKKAKKKTKNNIIKKEKVDFLETVSVDTGPTYYLEEDVFVDEKYVKNKSLVRMDMNIVQFPIFSKNTKRKKNEVTTYFFNKNKDTYITVTPSAGDFIPGEGEERIFIALMKIMKMKGMEQEFIVTASEIRNEARILNKNYITEIKKALKRLSGTNYNFKNTFYSNDLGAVIKEEASTPVLTFRAKKLSLKENSHLRSEFDDGRIKEVYWIKISDHFYKNIVKRGYLVFDSNILLDITSSVARTLYMLLEKIRFDNLYVRESIFALIKKIPLKYEKKSLSTTVKTLEKSLIELKERGLIEDFNFIKTSTWLEADVEVFFNQKHKEFKEERFYEDNINMKNIYKNLLISHTEKSNILDAEIVGENQKLDIEIPKSKVTVTPELIEEIVELMPPKATTLKTIRAAIKKKIEQYGEEKVRATAIYMRNQNVDKVYSYFIKAMDNDWVKVDNTKPKKEKTSTTKGKSPMYKPAQMVLNISESNMAEEKISKSSDEIIYGGSKEKLDVNRYIELFATLDEATKKDIEKQAERNFLLEIGDENFSETTRNIYERTKKYNIAKAMEKMEIDFLNFEDDMSYMKNELKKDVVEYNMSRKEISEYLNEVAKKMFLIYGISERKDLDIKMEIAEKLLTEYTAVTKKIIEEVCMEIISKYVE